MSQRLSCYRCGYSLDALPLPLGRRDECPSCVAELHVCRMCLMYDPREPTGCTEEDALEVLDKAHANFCDYFKPNPDAHSPGLMQAHNRAASELAALFGEAPPDGGQRAVRAGATAAEDEDEALSRAEDLFKSSPP